MKRLYLIRHAKSSWDAPGLDDFDRPLNERGQRDLPLAAERLKAQGFQPQVFFTSPALRAATTAGELIRLCGLPESLLVPEDQLYLAGPATWLDLIRNRPGTAGEIAACGHNPGITTLVELLTGESIGNLPTCGIACVDFNLPGWEGAGPGSGRLTWFDYPKMHAT